LPVLLAVPGYAQADDASTNLPDPEGRLWPDDRADARREFIWAAERPKRFLAAPVAVGTIDQALLSALQVKHAHLRSVCLDRHLLVVDEVHASDPYMREILAHLLEQHRARGGWALLLSATLGESARTFVLREPLAPLHAARSRPYPLLSVLGESRSVASPAGRDKTVYVEQAQCLNHPETLLPRIAAALYAGARVLVVLNTVARANALLRAVEASALVSVERLFSVGGVRCPHHGRFARADRELLDAAVSHRLGPASAAAAVLVIGTQTLEQSLDIDADWLVTDPCPMDVLLQRLGRLHRHPSRARPLGLAAATALVMVPPEGDFERFVDSRGRGRGPAGIGRVYGDLRILQRTCDVLRDQPEIRLPGDNRPLVEDALHPDALAELTTPSWQRHSEYLEGTLMAELRQAEIGRLNAEPFGECQFRANDEAVVTRLGAGDRRVQLPTAPTSPFGRPITELLIPIHLMPRTQLDQAVDVSRGQDGFTFALAEQRYRYTRFGLEKLDA
jgi:CRISPR-associated endonuclease/helicase Cas3